MEEFSSYKKNNNHYNDISSTYNSSFFYNSEEYTEWIVQLVKSVFIISDIKDPKIVDLGCGTANFSKKLAESLNLKKILCVEPCKDMLGIAKDNILLETLLMGAIEFSKEISYKNTINHILLKEVIHHIDVENLLNLFLGLHNQLCDNGTLLIITRPQQVEYPFFEKAKTIWKENQISSRIIMELMSSAGFNVTLTCNEYPITLSKTYWLKMIENQFWSTFSLCTKEELRTGINELENKYSMEEQLSFNEKLLFIVGKKS